MPAHRLLSRILVGFFLSAACVLVHAVACSDGGRAYRVTSSDGSVFYWYNDGNGNWSQISETQASDFGCKGARGR